MTPKKLKPVKAWLMDMQTPLKEPSRLLFKTEVHASRYARNLAGQYGTCVYTLYPVLITPIQHKPKTKKK